MPTAMKNRLIYAILSLLGLTTACSKDDKGGVDCMYGTPIATFSVKGNVTDTDGRPIKGIRVKIGGDINTLTDEQGNFGFDKIHVMSFNSDSFNGQLEFQDIDGEENGSFEDKKIEVIFIRNEDAKQEAWYSGDYMAKDTNVILQTKSDKE